MIDFDKKIKAICVTSITMVGYIETNFPRKFGNCFSIKTEDSEEYRVVNFNYENLVKLLETQLISFPITITPLGNFKAAIIADERISNEWYSDHFCTSCTPTDFLPSTQRLKQVLDIERGKRVERIVETENGTYKMIKVNSDNIGPRFAPFTIETI
jgi:hypothetical protein